MPAKPSDFGTFGRFVETPVAQMSPEMKTSEAPALLIAVGGGTQMVNYRVEGNYYVVDRLFNQAVLVSGVGRQQDRVTIAYAGEGR